MQYPYINSLNLADCKTAILKQVFSFGKYIIIFKISATITISLYLDSLTKSKIVLVDVGHNHK